MYIHRRTNKHTHLYTRVDIMEFSYMLSDIFGTTFCSRFFMLTHTHTHECIHCAILSFVHVFLHISNYTKCWKLNQPLVHRNPFHKKVVSVSRTVCLSVYMSVCCSDKWLLGHWDTFSLNLGLT